MTRPRLLIINHTAQLGGAEIALMRSIPALGEAFVLCAAVPGPGPLVDELRARGVEVIDVAFEVGRLTHTELNRVVGALALGRGVVRYAVRVRRRLATEPPDLIYANTLKSAVVTELVALGMRRPWVWHLRDRLEVGYLGRVPVTALRLLAAFGPRQVVANAQGTAMLLPARARRRTSVVPSPMDLARFARVARSRQSRCGGPITVAVVGRLTPVKGQHLVIEAVARAVEHCDLHLVVVGGDLTPNGDQRQRLAELAARRGISDRVEFTGHVDNLDELLARVDVVVSYPEHPEPFGQAVVQAMAAGAAVISADEGGPVEIVRHEVDGVLVPAREPAALADALVRLARDPGLRARLGRAAHRRAGLFDESISLNRLVTILRDACSARPQHE